MFVLIGAYGQNGGFGDYCSPDFVDEGGFATTENGEVVVFETKEEAEKVAEQMTVMCENIFWDVCKPTEYDGKFGMEWTVLEIPTNITPATDETVHHIFERYKGLHGSILPIMRVIFGNHLSSEPLDTISYAMSSQEYQ